MRWILAQADKEVCSLHDVCIEKEDGALERFRSKLN